MADFKTIKDLINQEVVTNGQGLIDAVLLRGILIGMLDAVGLNLDGKVDAVNGKSLILDTLITKLSNMPFITAYDYANHRVTLSDGTHSQVYQLTPYVPVADYYIGWTSGTKSEFAAKTAEQLVASATPYMVSSNPTYQHACTNIIFYVMFKTDKAPVSGSLNSGGLVSPITAQEFLSGGSCPHGDITYSGTTYKVYGLRNSDLIGDTNIITVNF